MNVFMKEYPCVFNYLKAGGAFRLSQRGAGDMLLRQPNISRVKDVLHFMMTHETALPQL